VESIERSVVGSRPAAQRARSRSTRRGGAVKLSISLPADVLAAAERECRKDGETRSDLVRRALEALVSRTREERQVAAYVAGYVAEPESDEEVAAASVAAGSLADGSEWD
jgi:hypothetical protein